MSNNNKQILPALLDKVDTAWTFIVVCIAILMIVGLAGLQAIGLAKKTEEDEDDPLY